MKKHILITVLIFIFLNNIFAFNKIANPSLVNEKNFQKIKEITFQDEKKTNEKKFSIKNIPYLIYQYIKSFWKTENTNLPTKK